MRVRPFAAGTVFPGEGRPHGAAAATREIDHEHRAHAPEDEGRIRVEDERRLLRAEGGRGLLRAGREGGLLRNGVEDDQPLRLPVGARAVDTEAAWRDFHAALRGFVSRRVAVRADADDIVQGVFLKLQRHASSLRDSERVGAWLYRAARHAVIDHYRSPVRRREQPAGDAADIDAARPLAVWPEEDADSEAKVASDCLRPMVGRLRDADRRAVEMVELEGLTQKEAAAREGLSLTGMKSRVQRARARLKAAMLACCRFAADGRGHVMECRTRGGEAPSCAGGGKESCSH